MSHAVYSDAALMVLFETNPLAAICPNQRRELARLGRSEASDETLARAVRDLPRELASARAEIAQLKSLVRS